MVTIYEYNKPLLDKLPSRFTPREAKDVGITYGTLKKLKDRGIIERVRVNGNAYIWQKA